MDAFVVPQAHGAANVYVHIDQGKENEATPAQLKKIFGSRYTQDTVFQQFWVENRTKNNPHEMYAFVLEVKGTNKIICNLKLWSRSLNYVLMIYFPLSV
jgi:hypothetical protein